MIFISHRKCDEDAALEVKDYLEGKGARCYIDVLDPFLKSPTFVTTRLIRQLQRCTHIIAIFSEGTKGSMWVPFELGAAYQADKGIGTFVLDDVDLPSYLNPFPVMTFLEELDDYLDEYRRQKRLLIEKTAMRKAEAIEVERWRADDFIERLKKRLD